MHARQRHDALLHATATLRHAAVCLALSIVSQGALPLARALDVADGFEGGLVLDWETAAGRAGDVVEWQGEPMLQVPAASRMRYLAAELGQGVAEVDVIGGGGIGTGGACTAMLLPDDDGTLVIRDSKGAELGRASGFQIARKRRLKVVFAGTLLRVFVDGHAAFETLNAPPARPASLVLIGGERGSLFDNVRATDAIPPLAGALAVPDHETLVFAAAEPVRLRVTAANGGTVPVALRATVRPFRGAPTEAVPATATAPVVAYGVKQSYRLLTDPEREFGSGKATLTPGGNRTLTLELGTMPTGLHMLELAYVHGTEQVPGATYPLAVLAQPDARAYAPPAIPVAVYLKMMSFRQRTAPIWWKTTIHALAHDLAAHGFNAVVACGGVHPGEVDINNRYGLAGLSRGEAWLEHPGVIGTFLSDEPKPGEEFELLKQQYASLRDKTDKALTTCMVGEGIGLGGAGDPVSLWRELDAAPRMFRWYGIKKHHYDIQFPLRYKGVLPFASVARIVEASADTPWWLVAPAFGGNEHEAYFQNPAPAQLTAIMHLACAHGADGLMLYEHQAGLVDPVTLQPTDAKLAAAGAVATLVGRHAELLTHLRYGHFEVRNPAPFRVEAVPRRTADGRAYVYVVNLDSRAPVTARLGIDAQTGGTVRDLFSETDVVTAVDAGGMTTVALQLAPGGAALLDLSADVPLGAPPASAPRAGPVLPDAALLAAAQAAVAQSDVAIVRLPMDEAPCLPGDAIGLARADDPRDAWRAQQPVPRCLSWSGTVHARPATGYLPLESALRIAEADAGATARWTLFPAVVKSTCTPGELRAMLHLALAYGSQAVLLPRELPPDLAAVADDVATLVAASGRTLARLKHAGLDIRCQNPAVAPIPRVATDDSGRQTFHVYAVNLDTENAVSARLLLWADVWAWTAARDVFGAADLTVAPRDAEGYLGCQVTLGPGEGRLILVDAAARGRRTAPPEPERVPERDDGQER